jgi:hypothetical protein
MVGQPIFFEPITKRVIRFSKTNARGIALILRALTEQDLSKTGVVVIDLSPNRHKEFWLTGTRSMINKFLEENQDLVEPRRQGVWAYYMDGHVVTKEELQKLKEEFPIIFARD